MTRILVALVVCATIAEANPDADFRAAGELAAAGDARAIDAYEALGAVRPVSRWTDDAWVEAARLAERARDYDRARRDLEAAIAISTDAMLVRRAKRDLERIVQLTGAGQWSHIAAEHQRLVDDISDGGDPTPALEELERLAKANPGYPRAVAVRIALARAWEQEDEGDRAVAWLRDAITLASAREIDHPRIELVRLLIRHRDLAAARTELARVGDGTMRATLERSLEAAEGWRVLRYIAAAVLLVLAGLATYLLRRRTGSWRGVARRLSRPPAEVIYFIPIAAVVAFVATTGNPLVAKAVVWILIGAALLAYLSGATIEAARPVSMRHALVHACVVGVAVLCAVYLAIDHARLLDLVAETWRAGPGH